MNTELFLAKGINVSCATVDGDVYVFLEDKRELLKFNEVGTFIWHQINGCKRIREIIDTCQDEYCGDNEEITEAVVAFLVAIQKDGLIKMSHLEFKGVMNDVE